MTQVNRYLTDQPFDHIDHALGRPVDPLSDTYRNYFATDDGSNEAKAFRASSYWEERNRHGDMIWFVVTHKGRAALHDHLQAIGDKHRLYTVSFDGHASQSVATTRGKAKYARWLAISDCRPDLTFKEFQTTARVRLT